MPIGNLLSKFAIDIFRAAESHKIDLFTSSHSIATARYILKKHVAEANLKEILYDILHFVQVVAVDGDIIRKGLKTRHKDFEDALQILCAGTIEGISCIVTRNIKDFRESDIPVLSPDQFVSEL